MHSSWKENQFCGMLSCSPLLSTMAPSLSSTFFSELVRTLYFMES